MQISHFFTLPGEFKDWFKLLICACEDDWVLGSAFMLTDVLYTDSCLTSMPAKCCFS